MFALTPPNVPIAMMPRAILREEASSVARLAAPITLAVLLELAPPTLTSMMIGQASGNNAAAVIAAGSLSDFFQGLIPVNVTLGLGAAVTTLCSQAYGAKRLDEFWLVTQAGFLASAYAVVPITILSLSGVPILEMLGQDPKLARIAETFILIGLSSLPFSIVFTIARSAFQAQHIATPFVVASFVAAIVSLPLGYVIGNYTTMGYVGVALSTIVSSVIKAVAVVPVVLKNERFKSTWPGWQWRQANRLIRTHWLVGVGSVLMTSFQSAGFMSMALLCGLLPQSSVAMAASGIGSGFIAFAFIPLMGVSSAGTVRMGNALGSGDPLRAALAARVTLVWLLVVAAVAVVACGVLAHPYARAFTSAKATTDMATDLSYYLLPLIPLVAVAGSAQAVFQACNAQWICATFNCVFLVAASIGFGYLCGVKLNGGLHGLWNGQMIGFSGLIVVSAVWYRTQLDWQQQADLASQHAKQRQSRAGSKDMACSPDLDSIVFVLDRRKSSLDSDIRGV